MNYDPERLLEFANDIGNRLGGAMGDMVPPDAREHLLNAQKELLTALFLIYEHQVGARRRQPEQDALRLQDSSSDEEGARPSRSRPPRRSRTVTRIEID
jgi:hypothetical protein